MKKKILMGLALLVALSFTELKAQTVNIALKNRYQSYPGFDFEKTPVLQSTFKAGKKLYGLLWSNVNLKKKKITEVNYWIGYNTSLKGINVNLSYGLFKLNDRGENNQNNNFQEMWLDLSKKNYSLTFVQSIDGDGFDNGNGNYLDFSVRNDKIDIVASIQYNNKYYLESPGFSIARISLSKTFGYYNINITPQIRFQKGLRKEFNDRFETIISVNF